MEVSRVVCDRQSLGTFFSYFQYNRTQDTSHAHKFGDWRKTCASVDSTTICFPQKRVRFGKRHVEGYQKEDSSKKHRETFDTDILWHCRSKALGPPWRMSCARHVEVGATSSKFSRIHKISLFQAKTHDNKEMSCCGTLRSSVKPLKASLFSVWNGITSPVHWDLCFVLKAVHQSMLSLLCTYVNTTTKISQSGTFIQAVRSRKSPENELCKLLCQG